MRLIPFETNAAYTPTRKSSKTDMGEDLAGYGLGASLGKTSYHESQEGGVAGGFKK